MAEFPRSTWLKRLEGLWQDPLDFIPKRSETVSPMKCLDRLLGLGEMDRHYYRMICQTCLGGEKFFYTTFDGHTNCPQLVRVSSTNKVC